MVRRRYPSGERAKRPGGLKHVTADDDCRFSAMGISVSRHHPPLNWSSHMLVLGLILLLIGIFAHISILYTIGIILLIIGAVLWILGAVGRPIGGRKFW